MSVKSHAGQVWGNEQTFAEQREQLYPPWVSIPWQAHNVAFGSVYLDGNPICSNADLETAAEVEEDVRMTGGVVIAMSNSR
jgi:hypothetical protein